MQGVDCDQAPQGNKHFPFPAPQDDFTTFYLDTLHVLEQWKSCFYTNSWISCGNSTL